MTAPVLPALCIVAPLAWYFAANRSLPRYKPSALLLTLALAGAYLLVNATWSLAPADAYRSVILFLAIVGMWHFTPNLLNDIGEAPLRSMAIGYLAGLILVGAFQWLEMWTDQWAHRLVMTMVPRLRPDPIHMQVVADKVMHLAPHLANRSMTVLTLLFWPAVLIIACLRIPGLQRLCLLAALVPIVVAVLSSAHTTSQIALIGSAAVFGLSHLWPLLGKRLAMAGYSAAVLLAVPAAQLAYDNGLYRASWLPSSGQHRVVIWGHTAKETAKAPLLGAGMASARATNSAGPDVPRAPGTNFALSTGIHSHNAYLQIWYETGAAGALIALGLGLILLNSLSAEPEDLQPALSATFAACALMAASSFSIWAPWFMALLAVTAILAALGAALAHAQRA